jgi:hypothetical protein
MELQERPGLPKRCAGGGVLNSCIVDGSTRMAVSDSPGHWERLLRWTSRSAQSVMNLPYACRLDSIPDRLVRLWTSHFFSWLNGRITGFEMVLASFLLFLKNAIACIWAEVQTPNVPFIHAFAANTQ